MLPSQFQASIAVPAMAALLCSAPGAHAMPTVSSMLSSVKTSVEARGFNGFGPVAIFLAVKEYLKDKDAWAPSVPDKCALRVQTHAGVDCRASINCQQADNTYVDLPEWNVCFLGGRQYFTNPDIGDFSITFTQAGGQNGNTQDGLHHPVFQFANLNNWEPMDVQAIVDNQGDGQGKLCQSRTQVGTSYLFWECGIPKIGTAAFGLSIFKPVDPAPGFTPGWCTMHVVQYQRNEYGTGGEYAFDAIIYDDAKKVVGLVQHAYIDPNSKTLSVQSHLPWTVEIEAKGGDFDPVVFRYGGQTWEGQDAGHYATLGNGPQHGYEHGNREGDMGFTC